MFFRLTWVADGTSAVGCGASQRRARSSLTLCCVDFGLANLSLALFYSLVVDLSFLVGAKVLECYRQSQ